MDSAWRLATAAADWDELLSEGQTQCRFDAEHLKKETIPVVETLCRERPKALYISVFQPPGRGPVPGPGINYTGPREILLELTTNLNVILYLSTCHTVHIIVPIPFMIMP